jgi:peptidyl-prolyl cis-trans isomerase D
MLAKIREKTQGVIATFILALIAIPFALWGINSYFDAGPRVTVAEVNGTEISQNDYRRALEPLRGQLPPQTVESAAFKKQLVESLVEQTLLVQDALDQGYRVSNARLANLIREQEYFRRDGQFDPERYLALLRNEGLTAREFEERLRDQNLTGQVRAGFASSGIVTAEEVDALVRLLRQERDISYAVVRPEDYRARVTVTPEEIQAYYDKNTALGRSPEQVRIAYLMLSAEDLAKRYEPTKAEIEKAYEENASRFVKPPKRRASHILVEVKGAGEPAVQQALARAQELEKQLRAGADFAALARKSSDDKESAARGGDLGEIRPGVLPAEIDAALVGLKAGQVSAPVRSSYGYHLVKLNSLSPEVRRPLAEVRNELVRDIRARKGEEKYYELSEKFRDIVYAQPESLEPAAKALGLEIRQSDWFTRSGGRDMKDPRLIEAAFQPDVLARTRNSDAIELSHQSMAAVRVLEHRAETRRSLADLMPEVERRLRDEKALAETRAAGEAMLKRLRAGERLETLARSEGLKLEARKGLTRAAKGIEPQVLQAGFRAGEPGERGAAYEGASVGSQGYAIVAVTRVVEPDAGKVDAAVRERARRTLAEQRGAGYYEAYRAGLRQQAKVRIYDSALQ